MADDVDVTDFMKGDPEATITNEMAWRILAGLADQTKADRKMVELLKERNRLDEINNRWVLVNIAMLALLLIAISVRTLLGR